jgi:GGDEF domain-containing protein
VAVREPDGAVAPVSSDSPHPEDDFGEVEPVASSPPADLKSAFAPALDEAKQKDLAASFTSYFAAHGDASPEQRLEALQLSARFGLPVDVVEAQRDTLLKKASRDDLKMALIKAPGLAAHMKDIGRAQVAKDDVPALTKTEWGLTGKWEWLSKDVGTTPFNTLSVPLPHLAQAPAFARALTGGITDQEYNALSTKQALGIASSSDLTRLDQIDDQRASEGDHLGAEHWYSKAYVGGLRTLPFLTGWIATHAAGAAVGAAVLGTTGAEGGAAVGGVATAPAGGIGAAPGAVVGGAGGGLAGGAIGAKVADFAYNFAQNFGPQFRTMSRLQKEDGTPLLTEGEARLYAAAASGLSSAMMGGFGGAILKKLPGMDRVMGKLGGDIISKALSQPTVWRTLAVAPLKAGISVVEGGALMASQAAANAGAEELAKSQHGQEANLGRVWDASSEAFKTGIIDMAGLTTLGAGREFLHDLGTAHALQSNTFALDMAVAGAADSKLLKRSPDDFERFVRLAQGDKPSVFIDLKAWDEHFNGKQIDPAKAAADAVGDGGKAYAEALTTGGDLVIPTEKYLSRLHQEHVAGLREVARFRPEQSSIRELTDESDRTRARVQEEAASAQAPADDAHLVAADIERKALASETADPKLAKALGTIWGATFRRFGQATGDTAFGAYQKRVNISIHGAGEEAPGTEPAQAKAAQLAQGDVEHPAVSEVREVFSAKPKEEQLRAYYEEPVTGLLNERGFNALPAEDRPLVGHISVEGVKFRNDKVGHEHADQLYRAVAEALHAEVPDAAKVGGDFAVRVKSNNELKAIVDRVRQALPEEAKGFTLTARAGESFKAAGDASGAFKAEGEKAGARAPRGERPKAFASDEEALKTIPGKKVAAEDLPRAPRGPRRPQRGGALRCGPPRAGDRTAHEGRLRREAREEVPGEHRPQWVEGAEQGGVAGVWRSAPRSLRTSRQQGERPRLRPGARPRRRVLGSVRRPTQTRGLPQGAHGRQREHSGSRCGLRGWPLHLQGGKIRLWHRRKRASSRLRAQRPQAAAHRRRKARR